MKVFFSVMGSLVFGLTLISCSDSGGGGGSSSSNGLASAFPENFALATPFVETSDVSTKFNSSLEPSFDLENPGDAEPLDEKIADIQVLLDASSISQCNFDFNLFNRQVYDTACYGPELAWTDHPDAGLGDDTSGTLPPGDLGIWEENETVMTAAGNRDFPCLMAKYNELFGKVEQRLDFALKLFGWIFCVANVEGEDVLPGAGETIDLSQALASAIDDSDFPIDLNSASITRSENGCDGNPEYTTSINGVITEASKTLTLDYNLRHVPATADNSEFSGEIYSTISSEDGIGGGMNCGADPKMQATYIGYERGSSLKAEVQTAAYCNTDSEPFDAENTIDPTVTYDGGSNPDGWSDNLNYLVINHSDSGRVDNFSYHWQAGNMDSHMRTLAANLADNSNGDLAGCGYAGFSEAGDFTTSGPEEMICNWAGPGNNHDGVAFVQRQCVEENSAGRIASDAATLNITYAPTNSCSSPGSGETFGGSPNPITSDLLAIADMDFTPPSLPDVCR